MIQASSKIKRHPEDWWVWMIEERVKSDEWEDGKRQRCCRSENTKRGSKVNTSHRLCYPDRNKRWMLRDRSRGSSEWQWFGWLSAPLTGPRGAINDLGQLWAASPAPGADTTEVKTPLGQLLTGREVEPLVHNSFCLLPEDEAVNEISDGGRGKPLA
ncbi:hypothetical protein Q8A73_011200 [Channa argus]|nr:hypothetical protein Q8A73_011200 [Channa argus]